MFDFFRRKKKIPDSPSQPVSRPAPAEGGLLGVIHCLKGQVDPARIKVDYESENQLYIVTDLSDTGLYLDNGVRLPKDHPVYLQEGTILFIGSRQNACMLGSAGGFSAIGPHLPPGTILRKNYYLSRELASGKDSTVYQAVSVLDRTDMEVHCLNREEFPFSLKGGFEDPGMVPLRETFVENNLSFYVLSALRGQTLEKVLEKSGKMVPEEAMAILFPVMDTLDRLHGQGHFLLNLDPSKIFLKDTGEVLIAGPGLSHQAVSTDPGICRDLLDRTYCAPELLTGRPLQNPAACDVYSVSVILYEMITGSPPPDVTVRHKKKTRTPYSANSDIYEDQSNVIMNGIHLDEKKRIATAQELKMQLTSIMQIPRVD